MHDIESPEPIGAIHATASADLPAEEALARRPTQLGRLAARIQRPIILVEVLVALGIWQLLSVTHAVNSAAISSPGAVWREAVQAFVTQGFIWQDLAASGEEIGIGFGLGVAVGIILGFLMGRITVVREIFDPIVMFFNSIPMVALSPLLIIWFGIGLAPKVLLIFIAVVFTVTVNTELGVRSVDPRVVEMARVFGVSRLGILRKVVFPSSIPMIIAGLRIAVGHALIMVVVAELFGATRGIGFFIINSGTTYDTPAVLMGVIFLAVVSVIVTTCLRRLERRLEVWSK